MVVNTIKNIKHVKMSYVLMAVIVGLSLVTSLLSVRTASAAALNNVMVRFDRMQTSTATTGTVCANPDTVGTEVDVLVTFPTGYALGAAGTFTVNTTNTSWPTGATAWPGINTATNVTGQAVTFPSTDLTVDTLYCFNWTNSAAVSTASGVSNANTGSVAVRATGSSVIDSAGFVTSTIADDTIDVTATVPQAFSFALSGTTDELDTLSTGAVTTSPTPRTVTVNTNAKNGWMVWAKDNYQGLCSPSVGTCTANSATTQLGTTATGSNRTLVAGTSDVNLGVTASTGTVATAFVGGTLGRGGGLSATALQTLVSHNAPVSNAVVTLNYNAAINGTEPAATDYSDTVTVVGAGLF